jgi:hypothetical protein
VSDRLADEVSAVQILAAAGADVRPESGAKGVCGEL